MQNRPSLYFLDNFWTKRKRIKFSRSFKWDDGEFHMLVMAGCCRKGWAQSETPELAKQRNWISRLVNANRGKSLLCTFNWISHSETQDTTGKLAFLLSHIQLHGVNNFINYACCTNKHLFCRCVSRVSETSSFSNMPGQLFESLSLPPNKQILNASGEKLQ